MRARPKRRATAARPHPSPDWARDVYETNALVYQPVLEKGLGTAPAEARGIARILAKAGIQGDSEILDLSCGIGRHSVNLAKLGYRVVGADPSETFLERARTLASEAGVASRTLFIRSSFSNILSTLSDLGEAGFGGILSMDNSIGVTANARDDLQLLRNLLRLAARRSVLLIEIFDREAVAAKFQWTMVQEYPHDLVRIARSLSKPASRIHEGLWDFYRKQPDGSLKHLLTIHTRVRHYSVGELKQLGESAGWRFSEAYSSLEKLSRYSNDGFRAFLVFERP